MGLRDCRIENDTLWDGGLANLFAFWTWTCRIQVEFHASMGFVASTWGTLQHITCKGTDTLHLFRYERDHWLSGPARSQRPNAVWCPELENLSHASQISLHVYTISFNIIYSTSISIYIYMCNYVDECAFMLCLHMCNFFWCIHSLHIFSDVVGLLGLATRDSQDEDTHKAPLMEDAYTYRLCYIHSMYVFFSWRWPILSWRWIIKSFRTWSLKKSRQAGQVSFRNCATTQLQENQIQIGAPQLSHNATYIYIYVYTYIHIWSYMYI